MAMSTKLSVAVHILSLIELGPSNQINSEFIASSVNTNPVVIRRLMSQLKSAGLISTSRGMTNTYLLKQPSKLSFYDIYEAVELNDELFSIHKNPNPNCLVGATIQYALEKEYVKVQSAMEEELKKCYLSDVLEKLKISS